MGVLTDLVLGTEADLAAVPEGEVPINVLPGLDVKGTNVIEFATLKAIVCGGDVDLSPEGFPFVGGESEEGPWVQRVPDDLVTALAKLDDAGITRAAVEWLRTEELQLGGWSAAEAQSRLRDICAFARRAVDAGKPVHMWTCL